MNKKYESIIFKCNVFVLILFFSICMYLLYEINQQNIIINNKNAEIEQLAKLQNQNSLISKLKNENIELKNSINSIKDRKITVKYGFNKSQLEKIISNVLIYLGEKDVKGYTKLLLATSIIESNMGYYFYQVNGPALGIFQMEPATEKCIINNYLKYRIDLKKKVDMLRSSNVKNISPLQKDIAYSVAMAYIHYKRTGKKLPNMLDTIAIVDFHKKYYNTEKGKSSRVESLFKIVGVL